MGSTTDDPVLAGSGRFQAVLDANVLYGNSLRDLLIRLSLAGLYRARWSDKILDEAFGNLRADRPDLDQGALERTRELMHLALPHAIVAGHEALVAVIDLPDPDDRHVVAAAVRSGAEVIVTRNTHDFPAATLAAHGIEAQDPDDFVLGLLHTDAGAVAQVVREQADALVSPRRSPSEVLDSLTAAGLPQSVDELRRLV